MLFSELISHPVYRASPGDNHVASAFLAVSSLSLERDFDFFLSRQSPATCDWILQSAEFKVWMEGPQQSILWMHAKPGTGKSVLASHLIRHLVRTVPAVQYFFFQSADQAKRTIRFFLRSLAVQLSNKFPAFQRALLDCVRPSGLKPLESDWETIWRRVFEETFFTLDLTTPVYWVIDGLDEAEEPEKLVQALRSIKAANMPIRIVLVGRWSESVSLEFERAASVLPVFEFSFSVNERMVDVLTYTRQVLGELPWPETLKNRVTRFIKETADGVFSLGPSASRGFEALLHRATS